MPLSDCLSGLNDTRSIIDLCLTTHLVFNATNTLTTGLDSITGILISSGIYSIETNSLAVLIQRSKEKRDTLFPLQSKDNNILN